MPHMGGRKVITIHIISGRKMIMTITIIITIILPPMQLVMTHKIIVAVNEGGNG